MQYFLTNIINLWSFSIMLLQMNQSRNSLKIALFHHRVSLLHIQTTYPTDDKAQQGWRTANIRLAAHYVTRAPGRRLIGSKEPRQIRQLCERAGRGPFVGLSARWGRRLTSRSVTPNSCRVMISSGRTLEESHIWKANSQQPSVCSHLCEWRAGLRIYIYPHNAGLFKA